jgi:TRAP-type C4-dicarboxylate transport system substrate-binding protein
MKRWKKTLAALATTSILAFTASHAVADETVQLQFQTHHNASSLQGKALLRFAELTKEYSNNTVQIEMHTSSSVVNANEAFEASSMGIIDGDATGAGYVTGKNPAFQFYGDIMGGYNKPEQLLGWYKEGGLELANKLYGKFNMHLVGVFIATPEALSSTTPLAGIADLKGWKFRSPPGMESEIFTNLGAGPVVMPFGEVFTAMSTGTVSGADASTLAVNKKLGLYDIAKYATYPGFHSMPIEHIALNLDKWNALSASQQAAMEKAVATIVPEVIADSRKAVTEAAAELTKEGVTLEDWSSEDRQAFRQAAQKVWAEWATRSPEAKAAYDSHIAYMRKTGILD